MSTGGFLGEAKEQKPLAVVEAPQTGVEVEVDEYEVAEREARQEAETRQHEQVTIDASDAPTSTAAQPDASANTDATAHVEKDAVTLEVEKILEEGLGDYVPDMPQEARERFLKKGGEVAGEISMMVRSLNVSVKRVIDLLKGWLLTIPGVNRYFIEQEAKIKTDKIVQLTDEHRKERAEGTPS